MTEKEYQETNYDNTAEMAYMINTNQITVAELPETFNPFYVAIDEKTGAELVASRLVEKNGNNKLQEWLDFTGNKRPASVKELQDGLDAETETEKEKEKPKTAPKTAPKK